MKTGTHGFRIMASTYCQMLYANKSLGETEKLNRWENFQSKVLNLEAPKPPPPPPVPKKPELPSQKHRLPVKEKMPSASSIPRAAFGTDVSRVLTNQNGSLVKRNDGSWMVKYKQDFLGEEGTVFQELDEKKRTAAAKLVRDELTSYETILSDSGRRQKGGVSEREVEAACSQEQFQNYLKKLQTSLGVPTDIANPHLGKEEEKNDFGKLDRYSVTTIGALWKFADTSRAILKLTLRTVSEARHDSYKMAGCKVEMCALPAGDAKPCFSVNGLDLS